MPGSPELVPPTRFFAVPVTQNLRYTQDRALVAALLSGQQRATDAFVSEYAERTYRFIVARLGPDRSAAEDVCQQVMSRVMRNLSTYRGEAALFTWVSQIARNEIANFRARRSSDALSPAHVVDGFFFTQLESVPADDDERPESFRFASEVSGLLHAALSRLPNRYASVLTLKYVQDVSVREIASLFGETEVAIQSALARARIALREALGALGIASAADLDTSSLLMSGEAASGCRRVLGEMDDN